jgi:hypothetical protein
MTGSRTPDATPVNGSPPAGTIWQTTVARDQGDIEED